MKLLTDEEIWLWLNNKSYKDVPAFDVSFPPDFSKEQPWFDYVVPILKEKLYGVCISNDRRATYWFVQFYPNTIDTFEGREPKLPYAFREALTKLVQENK